MIAAGEPITPKQIADEIGEPLNNITWHIRVLAEKNAIRLVSAEPVGSSMRHFYEMTINEQWALDALTQYGD